MSRLSRHHSLEAPVPAGPVVAAAPSQELRKLKMMQRLAAGGAASSRANAVLKELMSASPTEQVGKLTVSPPKERVVGWIWYYCWRQPRVDPPLHAAQGNVHIAEMRKAKLDHLLKVRQF